jgi:hypothetical protein
MPSARLGRVCLVIIGFALGFWWSLNGQRKMRSLPGA